MNNYFVTFGQSFRHEQHPTADYIHPDGYVVIEAEDYEQARAICIEHFRFYWSNLYEGDTFEPTCYPKGVLKTIKKQVT